MYKGSMQEKEWKRHLSFLEVTGEAAVLGVLAAHTCSWIIAWLGTETAACGNHPKEQVDTQKKTITSPALGKISLHAE